MGSIFRIGNWFKYLFKEKPMVLNTSFNRESGKGCSNANSNRDGYFLLASRNYRLAPELNPTELKISKLEDKIPI